MGAGPGLGLAIAKGLIDAHGGQIMADSPGFDMQNCPGSVFTLLLPIRANPKPGVHTQWLEPVQPEKKERKNRSETAPTQQQESH
jgi:signal transduction histidine kinase